MVVADPNARSQLSNSTFRRPRPASPGWVATGVLAYLIPVSHAPRQRRAGRVRGAESPSPDAAAVLHRPPRRPQVLPGDRAVARGRGGAAAGAPRVALAILLLLGANGRDHGSAEAAARASRARLSGWARARFSASFVALGPRDGRDGTLALCAVMAATPRPPARDGRDHRRAVRRLGLLRDPSRSGWHFPSDCRRRLLSSPRTWTLAGRRRADSAGRARARARTSGEFRLARSGDRRRAPTAAVAGLVVLARPQQVRRLRTRAPVLRDRGDRHRLAGGRHGRRLSPRVPSGPSWQPPGCQSGSGRPACQVGGAREDEEEVREAVSGSAGPRGWASSTSSARRFRAGGRPCGTRADALRSRLPPGRTNDLRFGKLVIDLVAAFLEPRHLLGHHAQALARGTRTPERTGPRRGRTGPFWIRLSPRAELAGHPVERQHHHSDQAVELVDLAVGPRSADASSALATWSPRWVSPASPSLV